MSRKIYSEVRSIIVNELKRDLYGPNYDEIDILNEAPSQAYLTGILYPQDVEDIEEEELADVHFIEKNDSETIGNYDDEEIEKENINTNLITNKRQNSLGIKCYISNNLGSMKALVRWGEYEKSSKYDEERKKNTPIWTRKVISHSITVDLKENYFKKELSNKIFLIANKVQIKGTDNYLVSVFLLNKNVDKTNKKSIYQVSLELSDIGNKRIFICENTARLDQTDFQEFLYRNKPIFAKGFGCAVDWLDFDSKNAGVLKSVFIPTHEIEGMSTELASDPKLSDLPPNYFSIRQFAMENNKQKVIQKLSNLAERYGNWIDTLPIELVEDKSSAVAAIEKCKFSLKRIEEGIEILSLDENAYRAFKFMNEVMHTQASMKNYSKNNLITTLLDELEKENFAWRPFQLAFILLNIKGIVDPKSKDRELVDLLWFPTGGGKTEAYLGIIAFLLGYRRLTNDTSSKYEKDGGVTVILRYTLRLLTTQQRDRLMRLIAAAEYIRAQKPQLYGNSEFSIGFWVGGQVTANKFDELKESAYREVWQVENEYRKIKKQVIECPCCGEKDPDYKIIPNSHPSTSKTGVEIRCKNKSCYYSNHHIPVYLIDEEIYRKAPSIIISTVDKFARLPWDEKTAALFGKVNRYCEKCGYIAEGEQHPNFHRNPNAKVTSVRPFFPPELIIQDELHLITGPLGTIYGLYETSIEKLATATVEGNEILPKYVAATATIKNAEEQVKKVFGRLRSQQFPSAGLGVEDSFFGREVPLEEFPFRLYTGICVSGHSMKTVILRVYAVLLQVSETLISDERYTKFSNYVDPYRTLIGYFNSVRELGGAVRLLDDDVRKRIQTIRRKYRYPKERYINRNEELTSRVPSYRIPKVLELLEKSLGDNELDVVLATNMISVGMDVDRLGLMVVNGQPKQTSEYIQASSRVGRSKPGLVVTVYNPYRPRDLSHYENFKGYHSRLYHFVEGTTATPFAARARDRALHALLVSALRLNDINLAKNEDAYNISNADVSELKQFIINRVTISDLKNKIDTERDINKILDKWIELATKNRALKYYFYPSKKQLEKEDVRLLSRFNDLTPKNKDEFDTLDSMRQIESTSKIFIKEGWDNYEK